MKTPLGICRGQAWHFIMQIRFLWLVFVLSGAISAAGADSASITDSAAGRISASTNLTAGWKPVKFTYEVQHPYDLKLSERCLLYTSRCV